MLGRSRIPIVITISLCLFSTLAGAEIIVLTTGEKIIAPIIEKTDTHVTLEVEGFPSTYFLGEIQTIDGQEVEIPTPPPVKIIQPTLIPYDDGEEETLIEFMNARAAALKAAAVSVVTAAPVPAEASDQQGPPTLQDFLHNIFRAISPSPSAVPAPTAAPAAAVAGQAAPVPVVAPPVPQDPPTLQCFFHGVLCSVCSTLSKM